MSLINDMLNNLNEQKNKPIKSSKPASFSSPFNQVPFFNRNKVGAMLLLFILINLTVLLTIYNSQKKNNPVFSEPSAGKLIQKISSKEPDLNANQKIIHEKSHPSISSIPKVVYEKFSFKKKLDIPITLSVNNLENTKKVFFEKKFTQLTQRQISQKKYLKAISYIKHNEQDKALTSMIKIVKQDSNFTLARQALYTLFSSIGKQNEAFDLLNENLELFPMNAHFIFEKAKLLVLNNQSKEALLLLEQISPSILKMPDYYNLMAVAYGKLNLLSKSGAIYQKLLQVNSNNAAYWLGYALSLEDANSINQAIGAYVHASEAIDTSPVIVGYAQDRLRVLRG